MPLPLGLKPRTITPIGHHAWVEGVFDHPSTWGMLPDDVRVTLPLGRSSPDEHGRLALWDDEEEGVPLPPSEAEDDDVSLFGTDCWGGGAWFGTQVSMAPMVEHLQATLLEVLKDEPADDYFTFGDVYVWYSWSFPDGTRLVLVYTSGWMDRLEAFAPPGVAHTMFGSWIDDTTLDVYGTHIAQAMLAQQGMIEAEDLQDIEPEEIARFLGGREFAQAFDMFSVEGRPVDDTDHDLLLAMAHHVLVDIGGYDRRARSYDPLPHEVAKALLRCRGTRSSKKDSLSDLSIVRVS